MQVEAGVTEHKGVVFVKVMKDASAFQLREKKSNWISSFIMWSFEDHKQPHCQLNSLQQHWVQRAHVAVFKMYTLFNFRS